MRLRQLNLVRYGHFTNFTLDFGDRRENCPDFHIIFGDNEAGKSTAFNAYLDLLFGIEERSKFNFLHDFNVLRVGATLEIDNSTVKLTRIKRRDANLLGANDQQVDKEILTSALHGLSREVYQTLFSLNDDTLERGGEEILASKGDLGRLLFAGSAGVADLSNGLEFLRERASKVYVERSHTCEISSLKNELKELDKERQSLNTQTSTYERLTETSRKAEEAYQCARNARNDIRDEHSRLKILKNAFPIWNDLMLLEKKLATIKHLPDVPTGWTGEVRELQKKFAAAEQRQDDALIDISNARKQLEDLAADPLIIKLQDELSILTTLASHDQIARECLPKLRDELLNVGTKLDEIRQRLGVNETIKMADLIVPDDTIASLDVLSQNETQLIQCLKTARQEFFNAEEILNQAQENEKKAAPSNEKVWELIALSNGYVEVDVQQRLNQAEKELSGKGRKIEQELKKLAPWTGNREDIRSQDFPTSAQANHWCEKANGLQKELDNKKTRQAEQRESRVAQDTRVKTLLGDVNTINDVCAVNSRKARNDAWAMHRTKLDDKTADSFEKVLADDDHIRDSRLAATDRLSQLRIAEIKLAETDSKLEVIADEINRINSDFKALRNEMRLILNKAGLPEDFLAVNLLKWIGCVQYVRELIEEEDECRAEWDQANGEYDRRRSVLIAALTNFSEKPSKILDLRELCEISKTYQSNALRGEERYVAAKNEVSQAKDQVRRRKQTLEIAENELKEWQKNWKQALDGLWLKQKNVSQIRALLDPLRKIAQLVTRQRTLIETISAKEKNHHMFQEGVCKFVRSLGLDELHEVEKQFLLLRERLENAKKIEAARDAAVKNQYAAEERLEKAKAELSHIGKRLKQMAAHCPTTEEITTLDHLALILDQAKQKLELVNVMSDKESHLLQHFGVNTRADAEMKLEAETPPIVEARLAKIDADLKEAELELERRIEERRDALRAIEAIGGDASMVRLEEKRRSILCELSKNANHSLALHLGLMTADRALAVYRDRHRSELLTQTAEAFRAITADEFLELNTQPDQSGDQLIAVRSNRRSITAEKMSKGTRFQLYLALRLAGYRRFCNIVGPLPFIGDDIMETFDDRRAESAMRQLSEIARNGQVIYFTHHRHLCEIAKDVCCGDVLIHEIPKRL